MSSNAAVKMEPDPIRACTICRDIQNFDLLIEDMETELGAGWGDLSYADAALFLEQPDAESLEFVALAMNEEDEDNVAEIATLIRAAVARSVKVVVIAEEVSPMVLHQLLKLGASEFVPYPLPEGALREAIERLRAPDPVPADLPDAMKSRLKASGSDRDGVLLPVHGLSGGVGATTFAVNLAWELATIAKTDAPRVCLIDLDLQYGSAATYLDLPRRDAVFELLSDTESMDSESFLQALMTYEEKLHVLTAPAEMLPLDLLTPEDVERLIETARRNFDYVVIDMPSTVVQWTETVLSAAHVYFALLELDMRSAQNALRLIKALKAEDLPVEKLRYILNRAPGFTDMSGKGRIKRLADSLDISVEVMLPDGGKAVRHSGDHGMPLAASAGRNPLRREIRKLAQTAHQLNAGAAAATR